MQPIRLCQWVTLLPIALLGSVWVHLGIAPATAQSVSSVIADPSLSTQVTDLGGQNFQILQGSRAGSNLFHSFQGFSIPTSGSVTFVHDPGINNIFSRVIGGQASSIDGRLSTSSGAANLFLLNPAGIIFGPNASLNLGGSFLGTTASSMKFSDGTSFSAIAQPQLLTVSVPVGLQFVGNSGGIQVQGSGHNVTGRSRPDRRTALVNGPTTQELTVNPGQNLQLVGSDILLDGAVLRVPQGSLALGGVQAGTVALAPDGKLDYGQVSQFGAVTLVKQSLLDNSGPGGSRLQVQGSQVSFSEGSVALMQNTGALTSGSLSLSASQGLRLSGTTLDGQLQTGIHAQQLGSGLGGFVQLQAPTIELLDGAAVNTKSFSSARSSDIQVTAPDVLWVKGFSPIDTSNFSGIFTYTYTNGRAGDVNVTAGQVKALDSGSIGSATLDLGNAGNVTVTAADSIVLSGQEAKFGQFSTIFDISVGSRAGSGNAGDVVVTTPRLLIQNGGRLGASTVSAGNAGSITLNARDSVTVQGTSPSKLQSQISVAGNVLPSALQALYNVSATPSGNGGNLVINTAKLEVTDNALVTVRNLGSGNAGTLTLNADRILLNRSGSIAATTQGGNGGELMINARDVLLLRNGGSISTNARGNGNGGNIAINAPNIIGINNSDITAEARRGNGGNITITTQGIIGLQYRLQRTPDSDITANSEVGVSGSVAISNPGFSEVDSKSGLSTTLVDSANQIDNRCSGQRDRSQFVATGRSGLPEDPKSVLNHGQPWADLRLVEAQPKVAVRPSIVPEAQTWQTLSDGRIVLLGEQSLRHPATCAH
jgi:filamentous hemagglutinin family protein